MKTNNICKGSIVDATIIKAASSTKNKSRERDSQMHQTKKGNECHFGMKAHIGVDAANGSVHTMITTQAPVADIAKTTELLQGKEEMVYSDVGYTGMEKRDHVKDE
ncbi:MAG TPA: transposase [Patescibacteria group bacterium]|nr:transposase [Patescibacteria group bacterium]